MEIKIAAMIANEGNLKLRTTYRGGYGTEETTAAVICNNWNEFLEAIGIIMLYREEEEVKLLANRLMEGFYTDNVMDNLIIY